MGAYFDAIFKTFTFSGRTSRKDFFMFILFDIIVTIALLAIEYEVSDFPYVSVFYFFVLGLTRSAITSRRLHDTGRSFSTVWSYSIGSVILGAIGAVFYVGNIYGSITSVKIYYEDFNNQQNITILYNIHIPLRTIFN